MVHPEVHHGRPHQGGRMRDRPFPRPEELVEGREGGAPAEFPGVGQGGCRAGKRPVRGLRRADRRKVRGRGAGHGDARILSGRRDRAHGLGRGHC